MEPALKQRLLGAAVLVALAVVFLPLLVMDPAPDSGASSVPLRVPPAPDAGSDTRTLDLPLAPAATGAPVLPTPTTAPPASDAPTEAPAASAATAAGDYAVNFGSYATSADAARVIAALAAAQLPAYQEPAPLGVRTVHRVRIGPFATAAAAEAARLAAGRVRSDVNARVVVLDAGSSAATTPASTAPSPATTTALAPAAAVTTVATAPRNAPVTPTAADTTVTAGTDRPASVTPPKPDTPAAPPAPTAPAAANVGFAVQLGAFANPDEAARLRDRARAAGFAAFVEQVRTDRGTLSRVRVGPAPDRAAADALRAQVASKLGVSGIVRPHP